MNDNPTPPPVPTVPIARTSGMAVTSLVLAVLGFFTCGVTALFGLILGIIAFVKIKNSNGAMKGGGLALGGIIVSAIFVLLIPIFVAMLLPAFAQAKQKAQEINCIANEQQLAMAVILYSSDHTNFPAAANWCDAIKPGVGNERFFRCPAASALNRCDYAFNSKLSGMNAGTLSHANETVLIFESNGGWNASGGPELMALPFRHDHGRQTVVTFADGHSEIVNQDRLNSLRWEP
ncbi:MAG TPA: DUF4190 domain-containing protein [Verrucomicrobiae bacterium]|nr:DUF4190 domain-containing protein [Verrucomicrobiae bacterium]